MCCFVWELLFVNQLVVSPDFSSINEPSAFLSPVGDTISSNESGNYHNPTGALDRSPDRPNTDIITSQAAEAEAGNARPMIGRGAGGAGPIGRLGEIWCGAAACSAY